MLLLPQAREACPHNLAPTTSSLMQLALGDALAVALLESRGFTALDFRGLHPGGRLGAKLKFIRDVMHTGASVPLIALGTAMSDAIVEMTAKGFGCVGITDRRRQARRHHHRRRPAPPHGRRICSPRNVDDVMTKRPKTVSGDQLVSEALELLNSSKITAVFVVETGTPAGIVHLHDLLRAGVA